VISVLSSDGAVLKQSSTLGKADEELIGALRAQ